MEYRKAGIADVPQLVDLRLEFLREAGNDMGGGNESELRESIARYLRESLADGSCAVWLALSGGEIAATSGITFYRLMPNAKSLSGRTAYISNMYTLPGHRRKGCARRLMELLLEEAREQGCGVALLNATDMGRPLYESLGFTPREGDMMRLLP